MPINQRFLIVKEKNSKEIKYFFYEKKTAYDIKPNAKIKDAINVNKMILINPSLIQKMVDKKLTKKFNQLIQLLTVVYENNGDDETGSGYREVLDEISKLRIEANNKYRNYMEEQKFDLLMKQLGILEYETRLRLQILYEYYQNAYEEDYYNGKAR